MTRLRNYVTCCALAILGAGCQWIAGISDRSLLPRDAATDSDATIEADASDLMSMDAGLDAGGDAAVSQHCMQYCESVLGACIDKFATYADAKQCLAVCDQMPAGDSSVADPTGNTVACRHTQADLAETTLEPQVYCAAAGPGGAGTCGDNCEGYCALYAQVCPSDVVSNCEERCAGLRDLDNETKANFDDSSYDLNVHQVGELLQCRLIHASAAALDPDNECWRAAIAPRPNKDGVAPPCTYPDGVDPRCEDYCRLNMVACSGAQAEYESEAQCMDVCKGLTSSGGIPPGTGQDRGGQDSIGCRMAHSYNAFDGANGSSTHCPHAGPGGQGVCGDNCTSYCRIALDACPIAFAADFGTDVDACVTRCNSLDAGPKYFVATAETSGDTVACRLLHATRAYDDASTCAAALGAAPCAP